MIYFCKRNIKYIVYRRENQIFYSLFFRYLIFSPVNLYSSADFIYLIVLVLVLYYCISPASTIQNRKCDFERRDITTTSYIFYELNAIQRFVSRYTLVYRIQFIQDHNLENNLMQLFYRK